MKRFLLAATALLLISTATASANYMPSSTDAEDVTNLVCGAPRVSIGEDTSRNPVVEIEVKYNADDHAWRIFHHLADGTVVSRSEQYAIVDASDDHRTQWRGSLNRHRSLYKIGEARREHGHLVYAEWLYDRSRGGRLVMQATAKCGQSDDDTAMMQPTR